MDKKSKLTRATLILILSFLYPITFGITIGGLFVFDKHPSVVAFAALLIVFCVFITNAVRKIQPTKVLN